MLWSFLEYTCKIYFWKYICDMFLPHKPMTGNSASLGIQLHSFLTFFGTLNGADEDVFELLLKQQILMENIIKGRFKC